MNKIITIIRNIFKILILISSFIGLVAYVFADKWINTEYQSILIPFVIIMVIMASINIIRWIFNGKI